MTKLILRRVLLIALLGSGTGLYVQAAAAVPTMLSATEARAVRAVIQGQLDAFAADDAERAFSFAAKGIRELFGDASNFMTMVRDSYPVVYRPASVTFLKPERREGQVLQAVQLTDASGKMWLALYSLQFLADRTWRIAGCAVVANDGRST